MDRNVQEKIGLLKRILNLKKKYGEEVYFSRNFNFESNYYQMEQEYLTNIYRLKNKGYQFDDK
jgi:L-arabinose isomerase